MTVPGPFHCFDNILCLTVSLSLNERKRKLQELIKSETDTIECKRGKWDDSFLKDKEGGLQQYQITLNNIESMLSPKTANKKQQQRLQQMQKRRALQLFEDNRLKRRALTNQGNKVLLDSDDEEFIAKCIEDKSTYHGRRHDLVIYTNRRVKKLDLLNIANYRLMSVNKKLIKSSTTVYNRCKPRNSRSIQAKKHRGK